MAQLAGMTLERRLADWSVSTFTGDSESHVSVWRKRYFPQAPRNGTAASGLSLKSFDG